MALFFILWDEQNKYGKHEEGQDLCQAPDDKQAILKEMNKNAQQKKDTTNYKCFKLEELMEKYNLKMVSKKEAELFGVLGSKDGNKNVTNVTEKLHAVQEKPKKDKDDIEVITF